MPDLISTALAVAVAGCVLIGAPVVSFIITALPFGMGGAEVAAKRKKLEQLNAKRKAAGQKPLVLRKDDKQVEDRVDRGLKVASTVAIVVLVTAIVAVPWVYGAVYDTAHNAVVAAFGEDEAPAPSTAPASPPKATTEPTSYSYFTTDTTIAADSPESLEAYFDAVMVYKDRDAQKALEADGKVFGPRPGLQVLILGDGEGGFFDVKRQMVKVKLAGGRRTFWVMYDALKKVAVE